MPKYDHAKVEAKWQKKWREERTYEPDLDGAKRPFFNLMMFPYPSAEGLHVGNMYAFTGSDIYGRYQRMNGFDVFEPIGLDGFGIHSENYAMKIGAHPIDQAQKSEKRFYEQLQKIGNGFAWEEHLETYDPEYYRWTQWIFVEMWKHGLAYRKKQSVNWCPKDLTVLADEQVENGKCERCGMEVIKKDLEQWSFRITNYADRLLNNLETLDWSEKVKVAQKNWIGKSEGGEIGFRVLGLGSGEETIKVFTTRPDTLFGATYLVLAPEHEILKNLESRIQNLEEVKEYVATAKKKKESERTEEKEKTGVELKGVKAINPANNEEIPIWVADYVLGSYGTGAIMAVPAHDRRDALFAEKFNLKPKFVLDPKERFESFHFWSRDVDGQTITQETYITWYQLLKKEIAQPTNRTYYTGNGYLINSGKFDGMDSETAKWEITKFVGGEKKTQFRLRDWLVGRQRYWGPPIPMVFCESCATAGRGERRAESGKQPYSAEAVSKGGSAEMPGWYSVPEDQLPVLLPVVKDFQPKGTGVSPLATEKDFYETKCPGCGGRAQRETDIIDNFIDSSWYYLRYLSPNDAREPFDKLRAGKWLPVARYIGGAEHSVLHLLYVRFVAMALHDFGFLPFEEPIKQFRAHGLVIKDGAKMSKSKGNVINPDEYVKNFGADTLRTYLMFMAPFEDGGDFRDEAILGIERFLARVWKLVSSPRRGEVISRSDAKSKGSSFTLLHKTIKKVGEDIAALHYNTAISALMIGFRDLEDNGASQEDFEIFLKLLAPFAPHITEEIWREMLGHKTSIHREAWPEFDASIIKEDTITLVLQINSRTRDTVSAPADMSEADATALALANEKIKTALAGATPKKIIFVPGKLVNIVV